MTENLRRIREGEHPFGSHPLLGSKAGLAEGLAREEFERAKSEVLRLSQELREKGLQIPFHNEQELQNVPRVFQTLFNLEGELQRVEHGRKEQLQQLAKRTVAEAYGLSEEEENSLFKKAELMDAPAEPSEMPGKPKASRGEAMPWLGAWVDKRVTHNALIQGVAINHMTRALALARKDIEAIEPSLYQKYLLHANLAQLAQFLAPLPEPDRPHALIAGEKRLRWENGTPRLEARGVVFSVLLQELSKGVMETIMAHGLPKKGELSEEELDAFQYHVDHPANEAWHFILGPPLATRVHKLFNEHEAWLQYGPKPSPVRDSLYTYTLLSMLPEKDLHEHLGALLKSSAGGQEKAAHALRERLKKLETDYTEGRM